MPFKSKAQQRWMFAAEDRGEVPKGTAERWADHTPDMKELPEKKKEAADLRDDSPFIPNQIEQHYQESPRDDPNFFLKRFMVASPAIASGTGMGSAFWKTMSPAFKASKGTGGILRRLGGAIKGSLLKPSLKHHAGIAIAGAKRAPAGLVGGGATGFFADRMIDPHRKEQMKNASLGTFEKHAKTLTTDARAELSKKQFALPKEKSYPIEDKSHAENALARVSQFGSESERKTVRGKVYSRYPELKENFKDTSGESPTSKENIKKKNLSAAKEAAEEGESKLPLGIGAGAGVATGGALGAIALGNPIGKGIFESEKGRFINPDDFRGSSSDLAKALEGAKGYVRYGKGPKLDISHFDAYTRGLDVPKPKLDLIDDTLGRSLYKTEMRNLRRSSGRTGKVLGALVGAGLLGGAGLGAGALISKSKNKEQPKEASLDDALMSGLYMGYHSSKYASDMIEQQQLQHRQEMHDLKKQQMTEMHGLKTQQMQQTMDSAQMQAEQSMVPNQMPEAAPMPADPAAEGADQNLYRENLLAGQQTPDQVAEQQMMQQQQGGGEVPPA